MASKMRSMVVKPKGTVAERPLIHEESEDREEDCQRAKAKRRNSKTNVSHQKLPSSKISAGAMSLSVTDSGRGGCGDAKT